MKRSRRTEAPAPNPIAVSAERILDLPRWLRILLVMGFSVALTFLLMPLIDNIYLTTFFDPSTVWLPATLAAGAGVVMYFVGWRLLIGYAGTQLVERPAVIGYTMLGTLIVLLVIILFVIGTVIGVDQ